ncbi:MAG: DUF885 family protein [Verrucomicrobia bacterium]|nr:DUF885 family protein [Verrucomicrobiota bacterium]
MQKLRVRQLVLGCVLGSVSAAEPNPAATRAAADYVPDVAALAVPAASELRELVERYVTDRAEVDRFASVKSSVLHQKRLREFLTAWRTRLAAVDYERLGVDGRIDATLLRTRLEHELRLLDREAKRAAEVAPLLPFAEDIARLQEARRFLEPVDPKAAAVTLDEVRKSIERTRAALEAGLKAAKDGDKGAADPKPAKVAPLAVSKVVAFRAAGRLDELKKSLDEWVKVYDGYDPAFGWWIREPHKQVTEAFAEYGKFLREKVVGIDPKGKDEPVIGDPIGRDGLMADLVNEMIVYSPEELIALAEREFKWVDTELKRAAGEMGLGDDWKAALEKVKQDYVEPGRQPAVVRDLALEAARYVSERRLVTVPPLAADVWLLRMMPPEQQKVAPFFLGGNDILVAFPTDAMSQEEKLSSLRANNRHFARATVFHELVPGHHLQWWARARFNPHRDLFSTPFWVEGWAVWWEFHLWDLKFIATPEDRMGALFWRAHRCARIIFSLKFHLGEWTPSQCIDFLVERVGHERASATGEVRRSFNGSYPPLYQAGYMLGAMQLRGLYGQLVGTGPGKMTEQQFHDEILRGGPMPIELVRARLMQTKLPKEFKPAWKFAD